MPKGIYISNDQRKMICQLVKEHKTAEEIKSLFGSTLSHNRICNSFSPIVDESGVSAGLDYLSGGNFRAGGRKRKIARLNLKTSSTC